MERKYKKAFQTLLWRFFSEGELAAFKLFCDRDYIMHRAGKGLTPNLQNSIYDDGLLINKGLKLIFLNNHDYPSEFRDTTVITPVKNEAAMTLMAGMVHNEYAIRII